MPSMGTVGDAYDNAMADTSQDGCSIDGGFVDGFVDCPKLVPKIRAHPLRGEQQR
jgi:hypothetical protein